MDFGSLTAEVYRKIRMDYPFVDSNKAIFDAVLGVYAANEIHKLLYGTTLQSPIISIEYPLPLPALILLENSKKGKSISIPSLGITIDPPPLKRIDKIS